MTWFQNGLFLLLTSAPLAFAQPGAITGTVVDASGASIAHAQVTLSPDRETTSGTRGDFSFTNVAPGPFRLTFAAQGFAQKTVTGELHPDETLALPATVLTVETLTTQMNVPSDTTAIAEAQIKQEEQQRFLGLVPNYFVTYLPDAAPLNTRQKFELSWKTFLDPAAFVLTGIGAGIDQAQNNHKGFGQGAQGYAKRYGADYADYVTGRMMDRFVTAAIFKQDPRYFYQGTGSTASRAAHAISWTFFCRGDNKQRQFCYSTLLGHVATGFLTNYYYPKNDRNSSAVVMQNIGIGIGFSALNNLFQEFIFPKFTKHKP